MKSFELNQILCEDINNLDKIIPFNSVSLSIVFPPNNSQDHNLEFKLILEKINQIAKPGGICCFLAEDEIDPKSDHISMKTTKAILEILDLKSNWLLDDKIMWIKSTKDNAQALNPFDSVTAIDFGSTPFTTIYVLVKKGSEFETLNYREKAQSLPISQIQKDEIMDDFWYIHPSSYKGIMDRIPKELTSRLIMLFTQENDLVLDPFSGYGITAIESKIQKRNYICIDKDRTKIDISKKRLEK